MKKPIKRLLCGLLCASLTLPAALAAQITPSVTAITLPKGETLASFDLILTADEAFAGAEFGLKPSADDIKLSSLEMLGEIGGNRPIEADKNGIHYFGFFTGSNAYLPGTYKVARLTYRYTGSASRTVTLTSSKIVTIDEDSKTTEGDTSSQPFTVTISRAGTTPSSGGSSSGGGGGSSVSADQSAANTVIQKINAIGAVTKDSGSAISSARRSYDALTDAQKKLVSNYAVLSKAESDFAALSAPADDFPFTDMQGHWARDAARYVYQHKLMNGTGTATFTPDGTLNRAMMTTMLYRMAGSPAASGSAEFTDVPPGQWYTTAVQWAAASGIVNGIGDGLFAPNANITREQMASMLMRYAQFKQFSTSQSADLSVFADADTISSWALSSLQWAHGSGLITGRTANTIAPRGTATRAEAATILMRFVQNNG